MRRTDQQHLEAKLREVLGDSAADATLEFLPPVPWDVLARHGIPVSRLRP